MSDSLNDPSIPAKLILVVDDLLDNSFLLKVVLESEGYQVEIANNGREALEILEKNLSSPPDLILLDIMMPEMSGYEVTQSIRENPQLEFIPILLLTAHEQKNIEEHLLESVEGLIFKPFDFEKLLNTVHEILDSPQNPASTPV